jgi:hypothetical protein
MNDRRNFSMKEYWLRLLDEHTPELHFAGQTPEDFAAWHAQALPKLIELMGRMPTPSPLNAEVSYRIEDGDLIRERVVFDAERNMAVPCHVLYRKDMPKDGQGAAILCAHGHGNGNGRFGKDALVGSRGSAARCRDIDEQNYDYARQMALEGYLTLSPDLRGFGERSEGDLIYAHSDECNVNYVRGSMLGYMTLGLNVFDMRRCIDYLQTRPEIDPTRIGMMGLSGGGTMTCFTAAVEPRIAAANICGYINPFRAFGYEWFNFCGMQVLPYLYQYFDTDDIAGLIAPRPLLLDMGIFDECFYIQDQMEGYERLKRIYAAAGVPERLEADIHPDGHSYGGHKAPAFFARYL